MTKGSIEFDARIEYRHGGSCGIEQKIKVMFLEKVKGSGFVFVCSNLGSTSSRLCANRSRVSVSFQGSSKYDIKLTLNNLSKSDSGDYQVKVEVIEGSIYSSITKTFNLTVQGKKWCCHTADLGILLPRATSSPLAVPAWPT